MIKEAEGGSPFIAQWLLTKSSAPTRQRLPRRSLRRPLTQRSPSPKNFSSRSRTSTASAGSRASMKSRLHIRGDARVYRPRTPSVLFNLNDKNANHIPDEPDGDDGFSAAAAALARRAGAELG